MSEETLKRIIGRAVTDVEFRQKLFAEPAQALAEYSLTEDELNFMSTLSPEELDAMGGSLEERISRSLSRATFGCTGTCACTV